MLLPLLGYRINKMQIYLWISTDANYFMLSLVSGANLPVTNIVKVDSA